MLNICYFFFQHWFKTNPRISRNFTEIVKIHEFYAVCVNRENSLNSLPIIQILFLLILKTAHLLSGSIIISGTKTKCIQSKHASNQPHAHSCHTVTKAAHLTVHWTGQFATRRWSSWHANTISENQPLNPGKRDQTFLFIANFHLHATALH